MPLGRKLRSPPCPLVTRGGEPNIVRLTDGGPAPTHQQRSRINPNALRSYLILHQSIASAIAQRLEHTLPRTEEPTRRLLQHLVDDVAAERAWVNNLMVSMQMPPARSLSSASLMGAVYPLTMTRAQPITQSLPSITELETLITSVTAKKALWQTLLNIADALPVNTQDVQELSQNADRQQSDLQSISQRLSRSVFLAHDELTLNGPA